MSEGKILNIENINIKTDILSQNSFIYFSSIINSNNFSWYFLADSANGNKITNTINYSWEHLLFKDGKINSKHYYEILYFPILSIIEKFGYTMENVFRLRFGLTTSVLSPIINTPHTDNSIDHKVILFYLDDSDGDTYFYENDKKTIIKQITPKKNTAIHFNGNIYHSSSKPIKYQKRIVLNINLK